MARIDTHKAAPTSKLYMMLAPHYTNNENLIPVKPEELSEARKIYPKGKFIRITEVKTTTYEVL